MCVGGVWMDEWDLLTIYCTNSKYKYIKAWSVMNTMRGMNHYVRSKVMRWGRGCLPVNQAGGRL